MAVFATELLSRLSVDFRLDPEFYTAAGARLRRILEYDGIEFSKYFPTIVHPPEFVRAYEEESGRLFLRAQNVRPGLIEVIEPVFVSEETYHGLPDAQTRERDLLLVRTGANLADLARVPKELDGTLVSSHTLRLVPTADAPVCALEFFFCSSLGRGLLLGVRSGGTHGQINAQSLRAMRLPALSAFEPDARKIAQAIDRERHKAKQSLTAAESLLMSALGLDHLDLTPSKCYERPFRDLKAGNRFGAEYYMPCKRRVLDAMSSVPHKPLSSCVDSIRQMWDPSSVKASTLVRNFDLSHALDPFLDDTTEPTEAREIGSNKKAFQRGDLVVSRLRSYLKEIAIARTSPDIPCVGSSEFIVLRPRTGGISAETLMIFLRCPLVQTILKWSQDGSNHPRFTEEDLLALPVPDKLRTVQPKIDKLVNESIHARQEAARLLEEAKRAVEEMIGGIR